MTDDPLHKDYVPLTDEQKALIREVKDMAMEVYDLLLRIDKNYDARGAHIAKTKLEEAVMWATKAVSIRMPDHES